MITPLHQSPIAEEFYDSQLSDHFEEIEWLLEHRDSLFRDGDLSWPEVEPFEQRLWPKLEVLLGHGSRGLDLALEAAEGVVEDSVRAGVFIAAHHPQGLAALAESEAHEDLEDDHEADFLIAHWFRGLEVGDAEQVETLLTRKAGSPHPLVRKHVARLIGTRRLQNRTLLQTLLGDADVRVQAEATLAAAKMGLVGVLEFAERGQEHALHRGDFGAVDTFALAQFLLGGKKQAEIARQRLQAGESLSKLAWALLALTGNAGDFPLFFQCDDPTIRCLLLGVHGYAEAVPHLLKTLEEGSDPAQAAADALHILTGAPLFTERWIAVPDNHVVSLNRALFPPDPTDLTWDDAEDDDDRNASWDMDDDEDEDDSDHETTLAGGDHSGTGFDDNDGFHRHSVDTDAARWRVWLQQHETQRQAGRRYRRGQPFGVDALIEEISQPESPFDTRRRALWELAHQQQPSPGLFFEPDWWIAQQQPFVAWLKEWRAQKQK